MIASKVVLFSVYFLLACLTDGDNRCIYENQNALHNLPRITTLFHFHPHMSLHHLVYFSKKQKERTILHYPLNKTKHSTKKLPFISHSHHAFHSHIRASMKHLSQPSYFDETKETSMPSIISNTTDVCPYQETRYFSSEFGLCK